jgi:hypothetical protein
MRGVYENPRQQHNCGLTAKGCSSAAVNKEAMRLATCCLETPNGLIRLFEQYL